MAARTRPKEARSKYPYPFSFTSIFTPSTPPPTADTPSTTPLVIPASPVAGLLHLFNHGFSHRSFRPVRDPSCIHSLVSHFPCTFLQFHWSHCTQMVIPAISVLGRYFLCCRYLTSHSGSSDTVAHHFYLVSTHFITLHHLASHFTTSHPILTSTRSISCSPFHYLLHRFISSWSFRPARYVFPHSYLPHTHTAPNGISLVIPAHQIPFSLIDCMLSDLLSNSDG